MNYQCLNGCSERYLKLLDKVEAKLERDISKYL